MQNAFIAEIMMSFSSSDVYAFASAVKSLKTNFADCFLRSGELTRLLLLGEKKTAKAIIVIVSVNLFDCFSLPIFTRSAAICYSVVSFFVKLSKR